MSKSDSVEETWQRVRDTVETVVTETERVSEQAKQRVGDPIDDLEQRIESLRESKEAHQPPSSVKNAFEDEYR